LLIALAVICVPFIENKLAAGRGAGITNTLGIVLIALITAITIWAYAQTGFNTADLIQPSAGLTGGMDRYSFAGTVVFTILFMIILIRLRMNSKRKK
jgi:formate hydrogenlyase subunit 3/multisubunit Na+/H+ antiporter MnhD subunit